MTEKVFAVAAYGRNAGSSRVRLFDWFDHLELGVTEAGFTNAANLSAGSLLRDPISVGRSQLRTMKLARAVRGQTVLLSRRATPFSNGRTEESILAGASHGAYDFDDSLMTVPKAGFQKLWSIADTWKRSVCAADVVIAGNDYLADQASSFSNEVVVVPSCVQPGEYVRKERFDLTSPLAAWIGSPSTENYLRAISDPLLRLHEQYGLRLRVISSGSQTLGPLDRMIERAEWGNSSFASHLSSADFGVMPLPDDVWTRGKCAYKLLQYGASALPLIGSPVGANTEVLKRGGGLSPVSSDDWYSAMKSVLDAPDSQRQKMGETARKAIEQFYSFEAWENSWVSAVGLNR